MSIWERLANAVADVSTGAALSPRFIHQKTDDLPGHAVDDALPFTLGMIVLAGKMAKADGVVSKDEVHAFKKAFKVSDAEMRDAARVFNAAKQDASGYDTHAKELVIVFKGDRRMLEYVLEGLFHIARADGVLHPEEGKFLGEVAKHLGFTDTEFAFVRARHTGPHERNHYDVLGVKPSVSNEELKDQYNRLLAQSQPDEFIARGLPKEFSLIATAKIVAIKEAYDAITKQRHVH